MPNHVEYDPGVPTFKHSDKFESRALVKMMQKEAQQAERAWEERMSQRDSNKFFFNHLTRDEADIETNLRLKKYEEEEKTFEVSESGEHIGTNLLKNYHEDISSKNKEMKELRKIERIKRQTEKKIAKAVEKKTGNLQGIQVWPPPEFPDAEKILGQETEDSSKPSQRPTPEPQAEKVEFRKAKPLPAGLLARLNARKKRLGQPEIEPATEEPKNIPEMKFRPTMDPAAAAKAAMEAMAGFDFSGAKLDVEHLKNLLSAAKPSQPPGLAPGRVPIPAVADKIGRGSNFVNMPAEVPIVIPGLPAGWKFGDAMPVGIEPEPEITEAEKNLPPLEIATSKRKRKRRPEQPVIFQADALGALTDPTKFTSKQAIQQKNLVPRQQAYQKRPVSPPPVINPVITAAPVLGESDQYKAADFNKSYSSGARLGHDVQASSYGTYDKDALNVNQHRNKYNRYKGAGVSGGGYR